MESLWVGEELAPAGAAVVEGFRGVGSGALEFGDPGIEPVWDAQVIDDDTARAVLDEFYALTENTTQSVEDLRARFTEKGLTLVNPT